MNDVFGIGTIQRHRPSGGMGRRRWTHQAADAWSGSSVERQPGAEPQGITSTEASGKILNGNEALCRITGHSREQLNGFSPRRLKSGLHDSCLTRRDVAPAAAFGRLEW